MRWRTWFSLLTNRQYHWRVKLTYRSPRGHELMVMFLTLASRHPMAIDCHRAAKKAVGPKLIADVPQWALCNGRIEFEPQCYLGWW